MSVSPALHVSSSRIVTRRRLLLAGLTSVAIAGGGWGWREFLRDRWIAKRFGVVEDGLVYRSGQLSPSLIGPILDRYRIQTVVDLIGDDPRNPDQPAEREAIQQRGIQLVRCPLIGDGTGDIREYAKAVTAIVESVRQQRPVLVHCSAGSQRTGGVIAAYRLLVQQKETGPVIQEMERFNWNPQRDAILTHYLDQHWQELATLLVRSGALSEPPRRLPHLATSGQLPIIALEPSSGSRWK